MIRLSLAKEPTAFDANVRQPGLIALDELVGLPSARTAGKRFKPLATRKEDIKGADFPAYWTRAIPDMLESYGRLCAYTGFYIHKVTGAPSVDHAVAKTKDWSNAYEWHNYRLVCSLMNARKGTKNLLDPAAVDDDWFALEFVGFQVVPRSELDGPLRSIVQFTIDELCLNDDACLDVRSEYAEDYWDSQTKRAWSRLVKRCPFVAREMDRQGLREGL